MIVENVFGLLARDRFFKIILKVDQGDPSKAMIDKFTLTATCDVVMNLSTGEKIKDRWDIHPTIYQKLFQGVVVTRGTDEIHIWIGRN